MQKLMISLFMFLLISSSAIGQVDFGIKGGMHSTDLTTNGIQLPGIEGGGPILNFKDSKYGYHFGTFARIGLLGIYVEPSFMFNSTSIDYTLEEIGETGVFNSIKNERYNKFDIPLMFGFKAGIFRLYGGPVAHLHISSSSDLLDFPGYEQRFKEANYGYQTGIGISFWKVIVDLHYEGNLSKFGDHIIIDGQELSFENASTRLMLTAGLVF